MNKLNILTASVYIIFLMACSADAKEHNATGFIVPDLSEAQKVNDFMHDNESSIPGKETKVEMFDLGPVGYVFRLSVKGHVYGYGIDTDKNEPIDFEIVDVDGDGVFETKYEAGEEYSMPQWIKE
ncbi:hypothetical protein [Desulfoplanes sp.]